MIKNNLVLFNKWLNRNDGRIFLLILLPTIISILLINLGGYFMFLGIFNLFIISMFTVVRTSIMNGKIKMDFSKYDLPEEGEILVVKKPINCTYGFINTGEYVISSVRIKLDDISIRIKYSDNHHINIEYFETRDCWKTKSTIRAEILDRILN